MFIPEKIFGILGCPLGHSLSPALHNWGFQTLGYPGAYFRFEKRPEGLADFMAALRSLPIQGLSVTIPHKEAVIPFLDEISPQARQAGAVNTILWRDGRLCGENTDVSGFCAPLQELFADAPSEMNSALILGAGGAARAVIVGLQQLGVRKIFIAARRSEQAAALATEFSIKFIPWEGREQQSVDMLINATPLGLKGERVALSPCSEQTFVREQSAKAGKLPLAYDLIYTPEETVFLGQAKAAGWRILSGFPMFVAQGLAQFEFWTGLKLPFAEASALLRQKLAERRS